MPILNHFSNLKNLLCRNPQGRTSRLDRPSLNIASGIFAIDCVRRATSPRHRNRARLVLAFGPASAHKHRCLRLVSYGSFSTEPAGIACRPISPSPRKRTFEAEAGDKQAVLRTAAGSCFEFPNWGLESALRHRTPDRADDGGRAAVLRSGAVSGGKVSLLTASHVIPERGRGQRIRIS
jgi:hypothetical protein